jgi:hypothetical protein
MRFEALADAEERTFAGQMRTLTRAWVDLKREIYRAIRLT